MATNGWFYKKYFSISMFLVLLSLSLIISSCQTTLKAIVGYNRVMHFGPEAALAFKDRHQLANIYLLDTAKFSDFKDSLSYVLNNKPNANEVTRAINPIKDLNQPIQLMCFNREGILVTHIINCHVGGFPNLRWNRAKILEFFPPRSLEPIHNLVRQSDIEKVISKVKDNDTSTNITDYTVFIFCNYLLERQSTRLIKAFKQKCEPLKGANSVKVVYVNNDEWYSN